MVALDGLRNWATDRPRLAAAAGGGILLLVVLVFVLGRGGDVAPTISGTVDPATGNTPAANGTVVAKADGTNPGATDPSAGNDGAAAPASVGAPATPSEVDSAYAAERSMNAGLPSASPSLVSAGNAPVSTPKESDEDVAFAGRKLELVANQLESCLATGTEDIFACLRVVPKGFATTRIFESEPQGAALQLDGTKVGMSVRGGVRCRTLGNSPDCNGWSAASD